MSYTIPVSRHPEVEIRVNDTDDTLPSLVVYYKDSDVLAGDYHITTCCSEVLHYTENFCPCELDLAWDRLNKPF